MNFKGKPKIETAEQVIMKIMTQKILSENEDDKELIAKISSVLDSKKIGDVLTVGEFFNWDNKVYKVIQPHTLTEHHNPSTPNTHLYALVLGEDEESG